MKIGLLEIGTLAAIIAASTTFFYTSPEPSWQTSLVENNTYGKFTEIDSYGEKVGIAYIDSIDTGLRLAEKNYETELTQFSAEEGRWNTEVVDDSAETGMYPSLESNNGEPFISYQDGDLGDEKLFLASRENGEWNRTEVDNVVTGGVSVGMYSSLNFYEEKPVIFYHSPSQGLKVAEKDGEWSTESLEDDMGWYTETSKCGGEIKVAYTGRNNEELRIGTYSDNWDSENTSTRVKSDLDIATGENCGNQLLYLDQETEQITYRDSEESREFGEAFFTRVAATSEDNKTHLIYYDEGTGIVYAKKESGKWRNKTLKENPEAGAYNDITVDDEGNIHVAFLQEEKLYHSVYNKGTTEEIKSKTRKLRITTVIATIILTLLALRKRNVYKLTEKLRDKIK